MGFSVPGEGKIDDIVLTSKQKARRIQNFVVFFKSVVYADCHSKAPHSNESHEEDIRGSFY